MGRRRRQGNTASQKANINITEDWMKSEEAESTVTVLRKMMIRMFNELEEELKENMQKQLNEYQENTEKKKTLRRHRSKDDFKNSKIKQRRLF
jgi:hypothetical protein